MPEHRLRAQLTRSRRSLYTLKGRSPPQEQEFSRPHYRHNPDSLHKSPKLKLRVHLVVPDRIPTNHHAHESIESARVYGARKADCLPFDRLRERQWSRRPGPQGFREFGAFRGSCPVGSESRITGEETRIQGDLASLKSQKILFRPKLCSPAHGSHGHLCASVCIRVHPWPICEFFSLRSTPMHTGAHR